MNQNIENKHKLICVEYLKRKIKESLEVINLNEAEYKGKDVELNKPFRTPNESKKFGVYVKNDKGNIVLVRFGDPNMEIKRDDPERRKAYKARHKGDKIHNKTKAGYWSWKFWGNKNVSDLLKEEYIKSDNVYYLPTDIVDKFRSQSKSDINFDLENDIEKNGITTPIILVYHVHDKKLAISDGHNRLDIANELNIDEVPVIIKTNGSDAPINAKIIDKEVDWKGKDYLSPEDLGLNSINENHIETLKGGLSDGLTLKDIAIKHNVDFKTLYKQYVMGLSVEREHTNDIDEIIEIVKDHLFENPHYYSELDKLGLEEQNLNQINSIQDLKNKYNNIILDLFQNDKTKIINLSRIIVPKELRNSGIGSNFMIDLTNLADKLGYKITLSPSNDFGGNSNKLKIFYNRFGFIPNNGKNKDFTHNETMYREPKI